MPVPYSKRVRDFSFDAYFCTCYNIIIEHLTLNNKQNMLTDEDIKMMTEVFATKEDLNALSDGIRSDFSSLHASVDAYAKKADTYF